MTPGRDRGHERERPCWFQRKPVTSERREEHQQQLDRAHHCKSFSSRGSLEQLLAILIVHDLKAKVPVAN